VLPQGVGNFDGPGYVGGNLRAPALIVQAGTTLTLMNEQARAATATEWEGGVQGRLSPDGNMISWTNGTSWRR
jgi:hypothetical protein